MLTGRLVRVRITRDRVLPLYLDLADSSWHEIANSLLQVFRGQEARIRSQLEEEVREVIGNDPAQLVHQGLAKLLEDRCDFEVVAGLPPDQLRETVFQTAAAQRAKATTPFDRAVVLSEVGSSLGLTPQAVDQGLFADLKSEQRLIRFKDITPERLLQRYNLALAQAVLLRSLRVHIVIRGESPQRFRQLLRWVKFHRLVCEVQPVQPEGYEFHLDGPLSLFSATQKYGLQLALFLPAILSCRHFELRAELNWGPQRKPKNFVLTAADGLVAHHAETGMYVPPELSMFVELFRKKIGDWELTEETEIIPLGDSFWVPDFRLIHRETERRVWLEVLGFWRRASAERHLERLRRHMREPFLLAVSEQLRVDEESLEGLAAGIHRFRQMPLPDEIARLASEIIS